jgi:hypothetical protein
MCSPTTPTTIAKMERLKGGSGDALISNETHFLEGLMRSCKRTIATREVARKMQPRTRTDYLNGTKLVLEAIRLFLGHMTMNQVKCDREESWPPR